MLTPDKVTTSADGLRRAYHMVFWSLMSQFAYMQHGQIDQTSALPLSAKCSHHNSVLCPAALQFNINTITYSGVRFADTETKKTD